MWSRLLSPGKARDRGHGVLEPDLELPGGSEAQFRAHPIWVVLNTAGRFDLSWSRAAKRRRHINIGELRAFLKAEKISKIPGFPTRAGIGGDSQVALGAVLKGRSASPSLNKELQASIPHVIGGGLQNFYLYCPTSIKTADAPTRGSAVPPPRVPLPEWWEPATRGQFQLLDSWLSAAQVDPYTLSGLPSLHEIAKDIQREVAAQTTQHFQQQVRKSRVALCKPHDCQAPASGSEGDDPFQVQAAGGQLIFPKTCDESLCLRRPGYLDLFSGAGGVARETTRLSGRWVLSFDIVNGSTQDLLDQRVQDRIRQLLLNGAFVGLGAAPVCSSFSRAITPAWRSAHYPLGKPGLTHDQVQKVAKGNQLADFVCELIQLCIDRHLPFWVENPATSFLWSMPGFRSLAEHPSTGYWSFDCCVFGAPRRTRTKVFTNTCLRHQNNYCRGGHVHQILRGRSVFHRCSWTKVAEAYPRRLSLSVAMALTAGAGDRPEFAELSGGDCSLGAHAQAHYCC